MKRRSFFRLFAAAPAALAGLTALPTIAENKGRTQPVATPHTQEPYTLTMSDLPSHTHTVSGPCSPHAPCEGCYYDAVRAYPGPHAPVTAMLCCKRFAHLLPVKA